MAAATAANSGGSRTGDCQYNTLAIKAVAK